jgi:ferritin-like metal-binding protein YciE
VPVEHIDAEIKEDAMAEKNLEDLFVDELKDVYDAERRITKALPKMAKAASSEELVAAFQEHLQQTEEQITRLDRVFESLGKTPGRKTCQAMVGLIEEGQSLMEEDFSESVMDAALISAAQKVEHYEIASYGCLRDWARLLDNTEAANLLQETLDEEAETDKKLTEIAQSLNVEAAEEDEEDEEETVTAGAGSGRRSGTSSGNGRSGGQGRSGSTGRFSSKTKR